MPRSAAQKADRAAGKAPTSSPPKEEEKLEWMILDDDQLKTAVGKEYLEYKSAQELATAKRVAFEDVFVGEAKKRGSVAEGKTLKFGYRFGNIVVAIVDDDGRKRGVTREVKKFKL